MAYRRWDWGQYFSQRVNWLANRFHTETAPLSITQLFANCYRENSRVTDGPIYLCRNLRVHSGRDCCWSVSACGMISTVSSSGILKLESPGGYTTDLERVAQPSQWLSTQSCDTCIGSRREESRPSEECTWHVDPIFPGRFWKKETFACWENTDIWIRVDGGHWQEIK